MIEIEQHAEHTQTWETEATALVSHVALEAMPVQKTGTGKSLADGNLKLIGDVRIKLRAVVGDAEVSVEELFGLKEGATLKLDAQVNAPIDLYFDNKLVARGELVVVGDNFGVSITGIET